MAVIKKRPAAIKLYNTLTRKKEIFRPDKIGVGLYTCGPTVYNYMHIGNLRTYVFEDIMRRALEYAGYNVRHVMNITDVDDKIIRDAQAANESIFDFIKPYEKAFLQDLQKLNIEKAWKYTKATEHIKEMVALIQKLLKKKMAYVGADGSVYFNISSFKSYGRLSRLKSDQIKSGTRALNHQDEYTKDNVQDFSLWKAKKEKEPSWSAPFGEGRPGWHIECSAMSMKYLGETFDIHGGAVDLIFPHHENEIAQSEGATGKSFARFFVEGEHLLVNGEKMSKSLGNFFTLRDIQAKRVDPLAFRYLALTAHYRTKLNFTWESLAAAEQSLDRLRDFVRNIPGGKKSSQSGYASLVLYRANFEKAIYDDLDTPKAIAEVWKLIRAANSAKSRYDSNELRKLFIDFDRVLGLGLAKVKKETIPARALQLANEREAYRKQKAWAEADALRKEIESLGYAVADAPEGPRIKKLPR
ncbi:MAG: cysteine--tRNA ligase [Candidatus Sungbacteria bacterium]|nr:cysteine--tRNA ligase [Candidatus Sungbacteria bacterium]